MRQTRFIQAPSVTAVALATVVALGALAGCGQSTSDGADRAEDPAATDDAGSADDDGGADAGSGAGDAGDELAAADGEPCPASLMEPGGAQATGPAARAPELPEAASAWICRYDATGSGEEIWELAGDAVEVDVADLPDLGALTPARADLMCTEEIGPRWLVVTASEAGDLTGVVVEDFGCDHVLLTGDPAAQAPGTADTDGLVPGTLTGPAGLATDLATLHRG